MPARDWNAFVRRKQPRENFVDAGKAMLWEMQREGFGINIPAQNSLACRPVCIAFHHLLYRGRLLAVRGIRRRQGTEHFIDG